MLESMTGYGSAEAVDGGVKTLVELRSVNNRFAEISVKLPRQLSAHEFDVRERIRQLFQRGKISVFIQFQVDDGGGISLTLNSAKVKACKTLLESLRQEAGISEPVDLSHMLKFSEIFESGSAVAERTEPSWQFVNSLLAEAIAALKSMRRREGEVLAEDCRDRILAIERRLAFVKSKGVDNLHQIRQRLMSKIEAVAGNDINYSKDRIETELVIVADKLDITEELTRFASHNRFFLAELESNEPGAGRKLNFLLQEQLREANTIASKSQSADISQEIVFVKEELEKIREQIQNIE